MALAAVLCVRAGNVKSSDGTVTVTPESGEARVVCLQVVDDNIVRVRATSRAALPEKQQSLIVVAQKRRPRYTVEETAATVTLTTSRLKAVVDKRSGRVTFTDTEGKVILGEAAEGKRFWEYRVPDREIGVDLAKVSEQQRRGLTWQMVFPI